MSPDPCSRPESPSDGYLDRRGVGSRCEPGEPPEPPRSVADLGRARLGSRSDELTLDEFVNSDDGRRRLRVQTCSPSHLAGLALYLGGRHGGTVGLLRSAATRILVVLAVLFSIAGALIGGGGVAAASGDPTAPTLNSAYYSNDGARLDFTAPSAFVGTTITSYDYPAVPGRGLDRHLLGSTNAYVGYYGNTDATASPYTDPNGISYCPFGTTCSWQIRAVFDNGSTQSPWSTWVAMTPFGGAPSLSSVNYSNDGATLNFTPPNLSSGLTSLTTTPLSVDGGRPSLHEQHQRRHRLYGNTDATASPYTDPNAISYCPFGTSCSWRIRAEIGDVGLQSPWSTWVAMTPFGGAPSLSSVNYSNDGATINFTPRIVLGPDSHYYDVELSRRGLDRHYTSSTNAYRSALTATPMRQRVRTRTRMQSPTAPLAHPVRGGFGQKSATSASSHRGRPGWR